jgi:hypothetical protein
MSERNPYSAPASKVADPAPRPGSPYKAVGLGLLTDFGGTMVFSTILTFVYGVMLAGSGVAQEDLEAAIRNASAGDTLYFWIGSIGGCGFSLLGGYVCARIARQSEYTLGVILAASVVVLGLLLFGDGGLDLGLSVVLNAATVAAVIVGAWIGKKQNRRQRHEQAQQKA